MNKVAIVTGASRGIGAATALELARRGYDLCINYIEQTARAEQTAAAAREYGVRCITHQANVEAPVRRESGRLLQLHAGGSAAYAA